MARNARRNYVRDGRGRFSSTPGGGPAKKARPARTSFRQRQAVSLARQRGQTGRLGSATKAMKAKLAASRKKLATNASPQQKAAVTRAKRMAAALAGERRIKTSAQAGVLRGVAARGVKKGLKGRPRPVDATPMGGRVPASQRPGSITSTLRGTLQALAKADAARIREIEGITGQPVRAPRKPASGTGATVRAPGRRSVSGTLGDNLRSLAQSDARTAREMADLIKSTPKGRLKGSGGGSKRKGVTGSGGSQRALPAGKGQAPTLKPLPPGSRRKVRGPSRQAPGTIAKPKGLKPGAFKAKEAPGRPVRGSRRIAITRSQIPATTTNYRQALPAAPSNMARLERARQIKQRATERAIPFGEMQKLRTRAAVADNPYSNMTEAQRTRARRDLANAELAQRKRDRSYQVGARAEDRYTNVVGYTEEGKRRYKRAGRRSTGMGDGVLRAGPLRSATPRASGTSRPRSPSRRSARMWYESASSRRRKS